MLRSFVAKSYRNLRIGTEPMPKFERINLLIGPNNSGKSNFMKALGFLRDLLLSDGEQTAFLSTAEAHGRGEVVNRVERGNRTKSAKPLAITLQWILDNLTHAKPGDLYIPPTDLLYAAVYNVGDSEVFPSGFYLQTEVIWRSLRQDWWGSTGTNMDRDMLFKAECYNGKGIISKRNPGLIGERPLTIDFPVETNETLLRQTKLLLKNKDFYETFFQDFEKSTEKLQSFARGFRTYSSTELDLRKLAEGAKIDLSIRTLDSEGSQFVNVLRYLDQKHDFLDEYAEHMRELIKDLKRIKVIDASDIQKQLDLDIGGHKYRPREMSDGTLKALWLALLLFSPVQQSLLAIDEPELNLHPAWLKVIGSWLQRFRSAEQLFVSTHSPELLDTFTEGFKSGQVALFVFGTGDQKMRRVEAQALDEFFKQGWELGDLYRVGEPKLGGWPW